MRVSMIGASALILGMTWMVGSMGCTDDAVMTTPPRPEPSNGCSKFGACLINGPVSDDNPCTIDECDACGLTTYRPTPAVTMCAAATQCAEVGVCMDGTCVATPLADGTVCFNDDPCVAPGTCLAGTCMTEPPVVCKFSSDTCKWGKCVQECSGTSWPIPLPQIGIDAEIEVGDANNDGSPELFVATTEGKNSITVLRSIGGGSFSLDEFMVNTHPNRMAATDLDGDGFTDLALVNWGDSTLNIMHNDGLGSYAGLTTYPLESVPQTITAGDLNGDGRVDLAVGAYFDVTYIFLNDGSGSFAPKVSYQGGQAMAMADFNGDTFVDLVVANPLSGVIGTLINNGDGTFQGGGEYVVGSLSWDVVAADIDGNGAKDLVFAKSIQNDTVGILLNNGDGTFVAGQDIVTKSPGTVVAADMNADGMIDLAVSNYYDDTVSLFLNNGSGKFADARLFGLWSNAGDMAVADMNGDGKLDLAFAHLGFGGVAVLLNECLVEP